MGRAARDQCRANLHVKFKVGLRLMPSQSLTVPSAILAILVALGEAAVTLQEILAIDVVLAAGAIVLVWTGWRRWQDK
jgi:threonine/homoserine/homoserine lactone efflux protein